jgi:hypothetical protein
MLQKNSDRLKQIELGRIGIRHAAYPAKGRIFMHLRTSASSFAIAAAMIATGCDKPSTAPTPSPHLRSSHDETAESVVALLMALRKEKKDAAARESEGNSRSEAPNTKPFTEPEPPKWDKSG